MVDPKMAREPFIVSVAHYRESDMRVDLRVSFNRRHVTAHKLSISSYVSDGRCRICDS